MLGTCYRLYSFRHCAGAVSPASAVSSLPLCHLHAYAPPRSTLSSVCFVCNGIDDVLLRCLTHTHAAAWHWSCQHVAGTQRSWQSGGRASAVSSSRLA